MIEVRVVPSVRAISAMRAADTTANSAIEPPPVAASTTIINALNTVIARGFAAIPSLRPKRRSSGPATKNRNVMLTMFMAAVYPARKRARSSAEGNWAAARSNTRKSATWLPRADSTWYATIRATNGCPNRRRSDDASALPSVRSPELAGSPVPARIAA